MVRLHACIFYIVFFTSSIHSNGADPFYDWQPSEELRASAETWTTFLVSQETKLKMKSELLMSPYSKAQIKGGVELTDIEAIKIVDDDIRLIVEHKNQFDAVIALRNEVIHLHERNHFKTDGFSSDSQLYTEDFLQARIKDELDKAKLVLATWYYYRCDMEASGYETDDAASSLLSLAKNLSLLIVTSEPAQANVRLGNRRSLGVTKRAAYVLRGTITLSATKDDYSTSYRTVVVGGPVHKENFVLRRKP